MPMYTQDDVTVLIAARNAQETIRRAVASVRAQSSCPIVLVDDFSEDDTVNLAKLEGGSGLTVVRPPYHGALGFTRQCGLSVIQTPLTLLLDADDAFLSGRIARFTAQMSEQSAELWADELLLFDGHSDALIRHIAIPDFIASSPVPYRLFERNYLPGVGQVGCRTELAKVVGYDPELHGPEDIDLVLRMMIQGARFTYDRHAGYAMYAYPSSVSRNLERQRSMYRDCLSKFSKEAVINFYSEHGAMPHEIPYGLMMMQIHQGLYSEALLSLSDFDLASVPTDSAPLAKINLRWVYEFYRGSLLLILGDHRGSKRALELALSAKRTPETLNNFGCFKKIEGDIKEAESLFLEAISVNPQYIDPQRNLKEKNGIFITLPEMRTDPSRDLYEL